MITTHVTDAFEWAPDVYPEKTVTDHGKFEGQKTYVQAAYELWLAGTGVEDYDDVLEVDFVEVLVPITETGRCLVCFTEDDQGNVREFHPS